ncbi:MAG: pseudouridine synthase [Chlamydiales bacterium]
MKKRLAKVLAAAGIASRRAAEKLILKGEVAVNGVVVKLPQTLVDPQTDRLIFNGKTVKHEEKKVYFLLNKPAGYICTHPTKSKKSILHFFSHIDLRLFTVGRLDQETQGLLLVTNDGLFAHRIIHPSHKITKEYLAKTDQEITSTHLKTLAQGINIDEKLIKPLSVKKVRRGTIKIVISEGKKHEVRLLLAHAGLHPQQLIRIRLGPLTLNHLPLGQYRELTEKERAQFV